MASTPRMVLARPHLTSQTSEQLKILYPGRLMISAAFVGLLSAAAVFLFLVVREQRRSAAVLAHTVPQKIAIRPKSDSGAKAAPATFAPAPTHPAAPAFERIDFSQHRSRSYHSVGPVRVRVLRTLNSGSCDLAVLVNNRRTKKLGVQPGQAIEVAIPRFKHPARMVIEGVAKNRVWGYLLAPKLEEAAAKAR